MRSLNHHARNANSNWPRSGLRSKRAEDFLICLDDAAGFADTFRLPEERYRTLLCASALEDRETALKTMAQRLASERRREGLGQGRANLILMPLEEGFGPVPADVVERVRSADTAELTAWSKSLLHARDLDGVFGSFAVHWQGNRRDTPCDEILP